jgi:DNA polymerase III subunit delta
MSFDEIMTELKKKVYRPVYLLMGDEPYFIDEVTNYVANHVLNEADKTFNQLVVYGKDTTVAEIDNAARRFPMMAENQVLIVKEAQNLKNIEELIYYCQKPLKSTILVLNYKYKTIPANRKFYKEVDKNGAILSSPKLYENQIPAWINKYLAARNYTINPVASVLLTDFLGTDLSKIVNELTKLTISLPEKTQITPEIIEKNIGISKDYNNFELQKALSVKDVLKANRIINYFGENQRDNPAVVTITSMFFFFSKILVFHSLQDKSQAASALQVSPYFVKDYEAAAKKYPLNKTVQIISILREYDLKLKGVDNVSGTPGELLKEMIFKILH